METLSCVKTADRKNLFLIEVLVKSVKIDSTVLLKNFTFDPKTVPEIPLTVKVKFSQFCDLPINAVGEVTSSGEMGDMDREELEDTKTPLEVGNSLPVKEPSSGKSCLFPMKATKLLDEFRKCPMYLDVFTHAQPRITPAFLGKTKISFGDQFYEVVSNSSNYTEFPVSAHSTVSLPMYNMYGDVSGNIEVYYRLSCFGSAILSDFSNLTERIGDAVLKFHEQSEA